MGASSARKIRRLGVALGRDRVSIEQLIEVSDHFHPVKLEHTVTEGTLRSRELLESRLNAAQLVYGVNTGFGPNVSERVSDADLEKLQLNLVRMLSCGMGKALPARVVRASIFARLVSLSRGHSGVRPVLLQALAGLLNSRVHPVVYEQGSVGASGDLVPLAHVAAAILGEGEAELDGRILPAREALSQAGLKPVVLSSKEGLALVNGTSLMAGIGALVVTDAESLTLIAEAVSALAVEVMKGSTEAFAPEVQSVRPYAGQAKTASNIMRHLGGSGFAWNPGQVKKDQRRDVQDAYSLRCVPQMIGAVRDMVAFARDIVSTELNSVSDNPLLFPEEDLVLHAGNFQGYHVSMVMDLLALALNQIGILSERRLARYVDEKYSQGLPPFLAGDKLGLNSGMMGAQLLATSIVAENRLLATPASIQSIPTNGNNQDVVSMGSISARRNLPLVENIRTLLAIELFALCQAAEVRGLSELSENGRMLYDHVRKVAPALKRDRPLSGDLRRISAELSSDGALVSELLRRVA